MRTICAVLCALSLAGCNRTTPTTPTPVTPAPPPVSPVPPAESILSISLIGDQWVFTNRAPVQMAARLVTSNTPFEYVIDNDRVTWSVEPSGVATVDRQGRVTPVALGTATVRATLGDKFGSNPIRVLPDHSGDWSGNYIITGCEGGNDPRTCGRSMIDQSTGQRILYPFTLALTQDRDRVTGTMTETRPVLPDVVTPLTGFVRLSGSLVLEASVPQAGLEPRRVTNWSTSLNATATQMAGAFTKIVPSTAFGFPYTTRTENEFSGVTRTP
jgi:hypothetical protein